MKRIGIPICKNCGIYHSGRCADFDVKVWSNYLKIAKILKRLWKADIMSMSLYEAKAFYRRRKAVKMIKMCDMTEAVRRAMGQE
jgi:hypothetical protein